MNTSPPSTASNSETLTESQKGALLELLIDEDPRVHEVVRQKLLSLRDEELEWLKPSQISSHPLLRRRVKEILETTAKRRLDNEFLAFCINGGEDLSLEKGMWSLAATQFPSLNAEGYGALIDDYAGEIAPHVAAAESPNECLIIINQFLFETMGFAGNHENYYEVDNSYLNRVLDRRKGNPISLCILYLLISKRLQLPVAGIGMPGHFLCRYQSMKGELYIDAFNQGRLLSKSECIRYLMHSPHGFQEPFLAPVTPRRIMLRVCSNLHQIHHTTGNRSEMERFQRYIVALAN